MCPSPSSDPIPALLCDTRLRISRKGDCEAGGAGGGDDVLLSAGAVVLGVGHGCFLLSGYCRHPVGHLDDLLLGRGVFLGCSAKRACEYCVW